MVHLHKCGRAMQWRTDPAGAAECCVGGRRHILTQCSLLYHACVCLGIDPDTVHCPLAGTFRACTTHIPAHYDEDADWPQINYYMRGVKEGVDERQGCRLFVGSNRTGGSWLGGGRDRPDGVWHHVISPIQGFTTTAFHGICRGFKGEDRANICAAHSIR